MSDIVDFSQYQVYVYDDNTAIYARKEDNNEMVGWQISSVSEKGKTLWGSWSKLIRPENIKNFKKELMILDRMLIKEFPDYEESIKEILGINKRLYFNEETNIFEADDISLCISDVLYITKDNSSTTVGFTTGSVKISIKYFKHLQEAFKTYRSINVKSEINFDEVN